MKTHISLNVRNVQTSIGFYQKVFGVAPQKQAGDYAKFDLTTPPLNFSLIAAPADISRVNHLGIEVASVKELASWEGRLQEHGILGRIEIDTDCCYARQSKVWFTDPDGNPWEVFTVLEQLPVTKPLKETGCCVPSNETTSTLACGCS